MVVGSKSRWSESDADKFVFLTTFQFYAFFMENWSWVHSLVVSDLLSETKGSRFESGC